jgi:Zn-dependent metalloprotease
MNEAFSDIFGESVDILNRDTADPDALRTVWPTQCHTTLNSNAGIPPGNDIGTRWSIGENITTTYPNNDGTIRDMYKPECFFHPGTTASAYYSCTTYADGGGVHKNSGVLNRLYAVLVDGGEYSDPASTTGGTLVVNGLGWVKAINLIWRTHQELTPSSQFMDLALTLAAQCSLNIGADLYEPNVFNTTITVSDEKLTQADCDNVAVAITGSGMGDTNDFCPNIDCVSQYDCEWKNCPDAELEYFYEVSQQISFLLMLTHLAFLGL